MTAIYIFSAMLIVSLILLIYYKATEKNMPILITKTSTSLFFVLIAVSAIIITRASAFSVLMLIGFCLCTLGDVLILNKKNRVRFISSIIAFLSGHLLFISAFITLVGISYIDILITLGLFSVAVIVNKKMKFNLGKFVIPVICYTLVISLMVVKAFSLIYLGYGNVKAIAFITIGATMFFISDVLLCYLVFKKFSHIGGGINLIFYYIGQMLLASSILYVI